jgi:hypothetical protein
VGLPLKAEFPAGASANRAAIPAPNRSVLAKTMVQSEGGQALSSSAQFMCSVHVDKFGNRLYDQLFKPGV